MFLQTEKRSFTIVVLLVGLCTCIFLADWYSLHSREQVLQQQRFSITGSINGASGGSYQQQQGYVIILEFAGQFVAGLRAIVALQCWLASFNLSMVVVEPYIINSTLRHNSTVWKQVEAATLERDTRWMTPGTIPQKPLAVSDCISMSTFNQLSKKVGRTPLVSLERAWHEAPRRLIVVIVEGQSNMECLRYTKASLCQTKKAGHDRKKHSTSGCSPLTRVMSSVRYIKRRGFEVVRTVCINCYHSPSMYFTPTELTRHIFGEYSPSEVTLVMSHWKFAYELSPSCVPCQDQTLDKGSPLGLFSPHPQLVKYADMYIHTLKVTPEVKVVAIMIRTEWFLVTHMKESLKTAIVTVKSCLSNILEEYTRLSGSLQVTRTVLALDIGKYGSGTFPDTLRRTNITVEWYSAIVKEVEQFVWQLNLDYDEVEERLGTLVGDTTDDRGYIAMLQSVIVSKADYIIRMGGGYYQRLAMKLFMNNHPNGDAHQYIKEVCITKHSMQ